MGGSSAHPLADDLEVAVEEIMWSQPLADQNREVLTIAFKVNENVVEEKLQSKTSPTF